jgi:hypothetical protein
VLYTKSALPDDCLRVELISKLLTGKESIESYIAKKTKNSRRKRVGRRSTIAKRQNEALERTEQHVIQARLTLSKHVFY